ncbi:succinate dehydrogenase, cytochrome b556 subunit [Poseidonocella sedimentorum]|uniref:Succinate dehydrogenase cytochrome b556 subunit n=1 Tax=Poseidonocella sedimentorum TaxID=871652 RepID=A0A1I6DRP7_9RHOB|nr:succinate dehydrogenase, cytochrome b556 subunit [Poseidonocella sedimentorum]SFR08143.1 succinate dehydrogenase subunit C [Poseidonocella sedimentorum]
MADVNRGNRPLSPHLQIYGWQLPMFSSILVRMTGIALWLGLFLVVWWLLAAATSDGAFAFIDGLLRSFLGDLVLLAATWAIFYHMLGRLRHVIWDFGYCLDVPTSEKLAIGMLAGATVLTVIAAILV